MCVPDTVTGILIVVVLCFVMNYFECIIGSTKAAVSRLEGLQLEAPVVGACGTAHNVSFGFSAKRLYVPLKKKKKSQLVKWWSWATSRRPNDEVARMAREPTAKDDFKRRSGNEGIC